MGWIRGQGFTGFRIRIRIFTDSIRSVDPDPYSESGSGSRRAKMTRKSRKHLEISCFEVLDVLGIRKNLFRIRI